MDSAVPYSARQDDLFNSGRRDEFFSPAPISDAALCAEMARLAYCRLEPDFGFDKSRIQEILKRIDFASCQFFESQGTTQGRGVHCFLALAQKDDRAVVAFRGTDAGDVSDVAYDADFELVPWRNGGNVHKGFAHALDEILPALEPALQEIGARRMMFTGHSLGAALATLMTSIRRPDALYTFGSPRVGDAAFVAPLLAVRSYRYVDCCDVVARVPPKSLFFVHLGKPYYINRERNIKFDPAGISMRFDQFRAEISYLATDAWKLGTSRPVVSPTMRRSITFGQ